MTDWVEDEDMSPEETWERFKALSPQRAKDACARVGPMSLHLFEDFLYPEE